MLSASDDFKYTCHSSVVSAVERCIPRGEFIYTDKQATSLGGLHFDTGYYFCKLPLGEVGLVQWWERPPPTNVARVRYRLAFVCGLSLLLVLALLRGLFSGYSGFSPSTKINISKFQSVDQDREPAWKPAWVDVACCLKVLILIWTHAREMQTSRKSDRVLCSSTTVRWSREATNHGNLIKRKHWTTSKFYT